MTGEEFRRIRMSFGLTQAHISVLVGRARQTIGEWENNRNDIDPLAARIMEAISQREGLILEIFPEYASMPRMPFPEYVGSSEAKKVQGDPPRR